MRAPYTNYIIRDNGQRVKPKDLKVQVKAKQPWVAKTAQRRRRAGHDMQRGPKAPIKEADNNREVCGILGKTGGVYN
jgi:hypothetical protein